MHVAERTVARKGDRQRGYARAAVVGLAALLLGHALLLGVFFAPAILTPDAHGYFAHGSLLAKTGRLHYTLESPVQYVGIHWLRSPEGEYYSRYPAGLALAVALLCRWSGPEAAVLLNPVLAWLSVLGVFLLGRRLASPAWGLGAALLLALNPTFILHAIACDSHMAVTALLVLGLLLLVRWGANGRWWEAGAAGLLLGCIPTVRYPETLFAAGCGAFLLMHGGREGRRWLGVAAAVTGALIPLLPLLAYHHRAFGAPWLTAYAWTNEQTGFGWHYFRQHAAQYLRFLLGEGMGFMLTPALLGVALWCARRESRPLGVGAALLVAPTTFLYMAYYWAPGRMAQGTMRFLLPLFPVLFVAACCAMREITAAWPRAARAAVVALLLTMQVVWAVPAVGLLGQMRHSKVALSRATAALREHAPPGAVVMAPRSLLQHLDFVRRWRLADPSLARAERWRDLAEAALDEDAPSPMQAGKRSIQTAPFEGLGPIEREEAFVEDLRAWAAGSRVFFVGTQADLDDMRGAWLHPDNFRTLARVPMPKPPPAPAADLGVWGPMLERLKNDPNLSPRAAAWLKRNRGANMLDVLRGESEMLIAEWTPQRRPPAARVPAWWRRRE